MVVVNGHTFWFDRDIGTYAAMVNDTHYGVREMQFPTIAELEAATGISLPPQDRIDLQNEFDSIPEDARPCRLTHLKFDKRITDTEWERINAAAQGNTRIARMLEQRTMAEFICLLDPDTVYGLRALEAAGLLDGPGRANQILGVTP